MTIDPTPLATIFSIQALKNSWERIASKNAAPGIDRVSTTDFSRIVETEIHLIHQEICHQTYQPQPLVTFPKEKKDHTFRELTIPTLRDKIVGKTIATWLENNYNQKLSPQAYAYRPHKGALKAVSAIEQKYQATKPYTTTIDIKNFFGSLDHTILAQKLNQLTANNPVTNLIMQLIKVNKFDGIENTPNAIGTPQGLPISPILSNIYLNTLDQEINTMGYTYLRYADDIIIFTQNVDQAHKALVEVENRLNQIKLAISTEKTHINTYQEGFIFLGFLFTPEGKVACHQAKENLHQKLAKPAYADETDEEYEARQHTILRGWKNYYEYDQDPSTIQNHPLSNQETNPQAPNTHEPTNQTTDPEEQYTAQTLEEKTKHIHQLIETERLGPACTTLRNLLNSDEHPLDQPTRKNLLIQLAEVYQKQGLKGAANACLRHAEMPELDKITKDTTNPFGATDIQNWLEIFGSSHQITYRQKIDRLGRAYYQPASKPLNAKYLKDHWQNRHTIAIPIYDQNNDCKLAVLDLDITRKSLDENNKTQNDQLKEKILDDAIHIVEIAHQAGVEGIIENSGYKGYHIWFLFHYPIHATNAKQFLESLDKRAGHPPQGTHREHFPASATKPIEGIGSRIKLPLGIHRQSAIKSQFLTPDGQPVTMPIQLITRKSYLNRAKDLKQAIAKWEQYTQPSPTNPENKNQIQTILSHCNIISALKQKAQTDNRLNHYERIVLRSTLVPLGKEGSQEIHNILKKCKNYSHHTTEKMLQFAIGKKPMGCKRIKEILSDLSCQVDCNCTFRPKKADYPHPLRHLKTTPPTQSPETVNTTPAPHPNPKAVSVELVSTPCKSEAGLTTQIPNTLEETIALYRSKHQELIAIQELLLYHTHQTGEAKLSVGTLSTDGPDTILKNWIIKL